MQRTQDYTFDVALYEGFCSRTLSLRRIGMMFRVSDANPLSGEWWCTESEVDRITCFHDASWFDQPIDDRLDRYNAMMHELFQLQTNLQKDKEMHNDEIQQKKQQIQQKDEWIQQKKQQIQQMKNRIGAFQPQNENLAKQTKETGWRKRTAKVPPRYKAISDTFFEHKHNTGSTLYDYNIDQNTTYWKPADTAGVENNDRMMMIWRTTALIFTLPQCFKDTISDVLEDHFFCFLDIGDPSGGPFSDGRFWMHPYDIKYNEGCNPYAAGVDITSLIGPATIHSIIEDEIGCDIGYSQPVSQDIRVFVKFEIEERLGPHYSTIHDTFDEVWSAERCSAEHSNHQIWCAFDTTTILLTIEGLEHVPQLENIKTTAGRRAVKNHSNCPLEFYLSSKPFIDDESTNKMRTWMRTRNERTKIRKQLKTLCLHEEGKRKRQLPMTDVITRNKTRLRWQHAIRMQIKCNRHNRMQSALNRVASRKQEIVREKSAAVKAAKTAKEEAAIQTRMLLENMVVSEPTRVHWPDSQPSVSDKAIRTSKKQIGREAIWAHVEKLRLIDVLKTDQEKQQQKALYISHEINYG